MKLYLNHCIVHIILEKLIKKLKYINLTFLSLIQRIKTKSELFPISLNSTKINSLILLASEP